MFLVDDILFSPLKGLIWLGVKLKEITDRELSDEGIIKERLMKLQLDFELDEISEEEYIKKEKELLERLDAIRTEEEKEV